jgi:lactoylglutathione lyase
MFQRFQVNTIVADVEPCVAFYQALGFEETHRFPAEGTPEHVEVRANGLTLGISSVVAAPGSRP